MGPSVAMTSMAVQEHVDALEAGKRGNRALNELMPVEDGAERVDADHVEAACGQRARR